MFKKQELMEKMQEELKKRVEIDPSDKKWLDNGVVDMPSAAEKRLLERIEGVIEATKNKLVITSNVEEMRVMQGQIQAMWSILATIKQWRDYAKTKEK
jgi:hypothetical protein